MKTYLKSGIMVLLFVLLNLLNTKLYAKEIPLDSLSGNINKIISVETTEGEHYKGLLSEVKEKIIRILKEDGRLITVKVKNINKVTDNSKNSEAEANSLSPAVKMTKDSLMELSNIELEKSKELGTTSKLLGWPGLILFCGGLVMTGIYENEVTSSYSYSSGYSYSTPNTKLLYAGSIAITVGAGLVVGSLIVGSQERKHKRLSDSYKYRASEISYSIAPAYNPFNNRYSLNLQIKF